jgi:hypothetical protein
MAAKEYPAQRQNSNGLPEGKLSPAKKRRQQPIPQTHYYFAADKDEERYAKKRQRRNPKQSFSSAHVISLMFS